jgi:hypothetical protein
MSASDTFAEIARTYADGDLIDAPHLQFLNRVPGVRQVVELRLAGA